MRDKIVVHPTGGGAAEHPGQDQSQRGDPRANSMVCFGALNQNRTDYQWK